MSLSKWVRSYQTPVCKVILCTLNSQAWNSPTSVGLFPFKELEMLMLPYAYEVTDNRGKKYLVLHGSTEHDNAVMFKYKLKPLYEKPECKA